MNVNASSIQNILSNHKDELNQFGVKSLSLFGSMARGDETNESDIDLLVEFNRDIGLIEFCRLRRHLEEWMGKKVDLATRQSLRPEIEKSVMKETVNVA